MRQHNMNTKNVEASFQLLSTSITNLSANNSFYSYDERKPGEKTIDVAYDIVDQRFLEDRQKRMGILDLRVILESKVGEDLISLAMTIRGVFQAEQVIDENTFYNMLRINGCAALYSIARAAISSISTQLFSVGNIVLPMVNFVRFHEIDKGSES